MNVIFTLRFIFEEFVLVSKSLKTLGNCGEHNQKRNVATQLQLLSKENNDKSSGQIGFIILLEKLKNAHKSFN